MSWTMPTGRISLSRSQHQPPQPAVRTLVPLAEPTEWDQLSPDELDEQLWILDGRPDDPNGYELRAHDVEPEDVEPPHKTDTTWSWDLDDPYAGDPVLN